MERFLAAVRGSETKKNTFFQKRTGEVIENKGWGQNHEPDRTGKRSGEVVENTFLWKKRTENEPENEPSQVVENTKFAKSAILQRAQSWHGSKCRYSSLAFDSADRFQTASRKG